MPAGTAVRVFLLAKETGWSLDYILWELPLSVFEQATHVEYWIKDIKARFSRRTNKKEIESLESLLGV